MSELIPPAGYSIGDIIHWLDQANVLLEQTLARVQDTAPQLSADDRQSITSNLVLIANVITHLSNHMLRPPQEAAPEAEEKRTVAEHPGVLERLQGIHRRMQAVYQRLQGNSAAVLN